MKHTGFFLLFVLFLFGRNIYSCNPFKRVSRNPTENSDEYPVILATLSDTFKALPVGTTFEYHVKVDLYNGIIHTVQKVSSSEWRTTNRDMGSGLSNEQALDIFLHNVKTEHYTEETVRNIPQLNGKIAKIKQALNDQDSQYKTNQYTNTFLKRLFLKLKRNSH